MCWRCCMLFLFFSICDVFPNSKGTYYRTFFSRHSYFEPTVATQQEIEISAELQISVPVKNWDRPRSRYNYCGHVRHSQASIVNACGIFGFSYGIQYNRHKTWEDWLRIRNCVTFGAPITAWSSLLWLKFCLQRLLKYYLNSIICHTQHLPHTSPY